MRSYPIESKTLRLFLVVVSCVTGAFLLLCWPQFALGADSYTINSSLRHNPGVTGPQIDSYIRDVDPSSPLVGLGQSWVNAGAKYNIDPVYLMSHAVLESGWGFSWISVNKKNIYGWGAYDRDPEGMAATLPTYEAGIDYVAAHINSMYLTPGGDYYTVYGPTLRGMNVHYATSQTWADSIAAIMNEFAGRIAGYSYPSAFREYDATYTRVDLPGLMLPGMTYPAVVRVNNNGEAIWPKDGEFKLTYRVLDSAGSEVGAGEVLMPQDVRSGGAVFVSFPVPAPAGPGKYTVRLDMRREGVTVFSEKNVAPLDIPVEVSPDTLYYKASYANTSGVPETAYAGNVYPVSTTVLNLSSSFWPAALTKLGYQWLDVQTGSVVLSEPAAADFDRPSFPAQNSPALLQVRTPSQPGYYLLKMDLIDNQSIWFASKGAPTISSLVCVLPDFGANYRVIGAIEPLFAATPRTVEINLANTSKMTWPQNGPVKLSYSFADAGGHQGYDARIPMPQDVSPGENVTVTASITPPTLAGSYRLTFDLILEAQCWFSQQNVATFAGPVNVGYDLAASYSDIELGTLAAGATTSAEVTVTNTSRMIWPANGPVKLSYSFSDTGGHQGYAARVPMPADVRPQETVTLPVSIANPAAPGVYNLRFDLIDERAGWLSQAGMTAPSQAVVVFRAYGAAYKRITTFPRLPVGTTEIISVGVTNTGHIVWPAGSTVSLSYSFSDTGAHQGYESRIAMPQPIAPGETVDLTVPLVVPSVPGSYTLKFDLIANGVTWFSEEGGTPAALSIQVLQ